MISSTRGHNSSTTFSARTTGIDAAWLPELAREEPARNAFRLTIIVPVCNERHIVEASLRRLLALQHDLIASLEVLVVDDGSTDGSDRVLQQLAAEDRRIVLLRHSVSRGKGASIRSALERTTGDIVLIHDASLEYEPGDIPALIVPFAREGADAVFGSRYLSAPYRRALRFRHTLLNRILTLLSNCLTDLTLTDVATCYKAINAELLKSIPLRSDDFRFELEIVFKLAKRRARVFETPIRYLPRTNAERKTIRARDGLLALVAMIRFWLVDDLYHDDEYGSQILVELERTQRFNTWMADALRAYVGDRVLEIGAGIGNLTAQLIPRDLYIASDVNPHYLRYLRAYAVGKPYLRALKVDVENLDDVTNLEGRFDTVLMLNVLEHLSEPEAALRHAWATLADGGRAVILVPQHPRLYGSLDRALGHRRRFTPGELEGVLRAAGFEIETIFDFNRVSAPAWWFNGTLLRRRTFSRIQLKIFDVMIPLLRRIDRLWPWAGMSAIAVGVKRRAGHQPSAISHQP